ncbi:MAG: V-type ATP synthase subunit F [Steroidobacteraceae bacterium]
MAVAVAIADEITAAGFRLAGVRTLVVTPDAVPDAFDRACRDAALVFVTAELARHLPRARLAAALEAHAPIVAVIPDIEARSVAPDLGAELRRALGVVE